MSSPVGSDERQPLLPSHTDPHPHPDSSDQPRSRHRVVEGAQFLRNFLYEDPILFCTFSLQFCTYFAKHIVEVPMIKLFEQAICTRYYNEHRDLHSLVSGASEERLCKIPAIQNELAGLVGLKFTFDALPG